MLCWRIYSTAKAWDVTPSKLLNIEDDYAAFCLDEGLAEMGGFIQSELKKIKGKKQKVVDARRAAMLEAIITGNPAKRFADPAARMNK